MITISTPKNQKKLLLLFFFLFIFTANAQIGIGTVTPNASSILDITSTTQGLLPPRMTSAQRTAIATPADGLMVYDTTLKSLYYYNSTSASWLPLVNGSSSRLNYKLIKSTDVLATVLAAEKTAGGGTKYLMDSNTVYEINGTINLDLPIELNNCYIEGLDANGDVLSRAGGIFVGSTGGSVKMLTLTASSGSVFALTGAASQTLLVRDCIVAGCSSVGSVSGFGLTFFSVIQFLSNANGITFDNIAYVLLSQMAWFGSNQGTFEKYTGTFSLIEKQGGFSQVVGTAVGLDVSNNPVITGDAVLESVVFTGTLTTGAYVKGYTTGAYTGYSFNNNWTVRAAGIPTESDTNATGDFAVDYAVGTGIAVSFNSSNPSNIVKIGNASTVYTTSNLFRFSAPSSDPARLVYQGKKKRIFQIAGSVSFQVPFAGTYIIYIAKNGSVLTQYKVYGRGAASNDIVVLPVNGTVELSNGEYIEIFAQRYTGNTGNIVVPNMTITLK